MRMKRKNTKSGLPGLVDQLRVELAAAKSELGLAKAELAAAKSGLAERDGRILRLKAANENLRRLIFGAKSERFVDVPGMEQPLLTGFESIFGDAAAGKPETVKFDVERRRHRNQAGRMEIPGHLPRIERIIDCPESEKFDPATGEPLKFFGYEESLRIGFKQEMFVEVTKRAKYVNPNNPRFGVLTAPVPPCAVAKSLFTDDFLAYMMTQKAVYHMPVNRIAMMVSSHGVPVKRCTLNRLFHKGAELLRFIYNEMLRQLLLERYIFSDDTTVNMLAPGKGKVKQGRIWCAVSGTGPPLVVYEFTPDRTKERPAKFFKSFRGFLHADDYAGYDILFRTRDADGNPVIVHVACWAHVRRKFSDIYKSTKCPEAAAMLSIIRKLYEIESRGAGLPDGQLAALRQNESRPVLDAFFAKASGIVMREPPSTPLARAAAYAVNLKTELSRFLGHAFLTLDNNPVEREHRVVAVGRKNWNFVGDEKHGQNLAVVMSVTETCRRLGVDPLEYLSDVLPRIMDHPARRIDELLPGPWLAAKQAAAATAAEATVEATATNAA